VKSQWPAKSVSHRRAFEIWGAFSSTSAAGTATTFSSVTATTSTATAGFCETAGRSSEEEDEEDDWAQHCGANHVHNATQSAKVAIAFCSVRPRSRAPFVQRLFWLGLFWQDLLWKDALGKTLLLCRGSCPNQFSQKMKIDRPNEKMRREIRRLLACGPTSRTPTPR